MRPINFSKSLAPIFLALFMFLKQCVIVGGLPFRVKKPQYSKGLIEAIGEAERMSKNPNTPAYKTFEEYQAAMQEYLDEDE